MELHRIRLHGPWQWCRLGEGGDHVEVPPPGLEQQTNASVRLPGEYCWDEPVNASLLRPTSSLVFSEVRADSSQASPDGREPGRSSGSETDCFPIAVVRRFNRPTGLAPGQVILLGCWSTHEVVAAWLNDRALSPAQFNFPEAASSCFLLSAESLLAYNSVGLVFRLGKSKRLQIDQVALGLCSTS